MSAILETRSPKVAAELDREFDVELALQRRINESVDMSMCIGSSTGEILGASDRLDGLYDDNVNAPTMCFWGAFVK